jgi:hypothetical protein
MECRPAAGMDERDGCPLSPSATIHRTNFVNSSAPSARTPSFATCRTADHQLATATADSPMAAAVHSQRRASGFGISETCSKDAFGVARKSTVGPAGTGRGSGRGAGLAISSNPS